jgi:hypothetical protein
MLTFLIDPTDPLATLEDCAVQIDFVTDLMSQGADGEITISDAGAAGFCDVLRAVSRAMHNVNVAVRTIYAAGLEVVESAADPVASDEPDQRSAWRRSMIAQLLAEADRVADVVPIASEVDSVPDAVTIAGGIVATVAPCLTEPRQPPRQRRAA